MTILIDADGCPGVSDVMKNKTSCRTLPPPCSHPHHLCRKKGTSLSRCLLLAEMVGILPRAKQQPAGLIACGLRTAALFSSSPSSRKKGTSLS